NWRYTSSGLLLRSQYFLSDDGGGVYLGPFIGYRSIALKTVVNSSYSYPYTNSPWEGSHSYQATVVPLGLRFGVRSELDGFFMDYYFGLGTNIGHSSALDLPYAGNKGIVRSTYLQFGLSYGIGWD
ncbi:MAG TPA: hypothetical protein PK760_00245, partial [Flavobacteriales bacterium]|nr:hypothetical protein [Flavobacteriales bacterium]